MEKIVTCPQHLDREVGFVYLNNENKYNSRLACNLCIEEYETMENFRDFKTFLQGLGPIFKLKNRQAGPYDELVSYFDYLNIDFDKLFQEFVKKVTEQIDQLKALMKNQIIEFNKMKEMIKVGSQKLKDLCGHTQFKQLHDKVYTIKEYHKSNEWKQMEEALNQVIINCNTQNNQEINDILRGIQQHAAAYSQQADYAKLLDIETTIQNEYNNVQQKLHLSLNVGMFGITKLCPSEFFDKILIQIKAAQKVEKKLQLLYTTNDGLDQLWDKIQGQGPLLFFFKSEKAVFGAYTPFKLKPDAKWYEKTEKEQDDKADEKNSSFLFSVTRKEVYGLQKDKRFKAVYCFSLDQDNQDKYLLNFGLGPDLSITSTLQCTSIFNGSYGTTKVNQPKTHLLGEEKANIKQIEVFLVE
ncbi:hypothetical protein pb186bvf_020143 [Paramecium bursaria]